MERVVGRRHARRARTVLVLGIAAAASLAWPDPAPAEEPTRHGWAVAQASAAALAPEVGGLPVPVLFGAAAADVNATRARARAIDVDAGVLGMLATTEMCGQVLVRPDQLPQPVRAASPDGPAEASRDGASVPGDVVAATVDHLAASAGTDPSGDAVADGTSVSFGGIVTADAVRVRAWSHALDGSTREAVATVDYGGITVGPVRLEGVHTEAYHRSGAVDELGTRFRIGAIEIAGSRVEPPPEADAAAVLGPANAVLAALGVTIQPPREEVVGSTVHLRPLQIRIGGSALSSPVVSPLLGALQPLRDQVAAVLAGECGASSVFTLADLVAGVASGSGSLAVQLGAVEAGSGEVEVSNPFGAGLAPFGPAPAGPASVSAAGAGQRRAPAVTPESATPTPAPAGGQPSALTRPVSSVLEAPAGRAWLAVLLALPVLVLLAGRDWWVMRAASRSLVERS